MDNAVKGTGYKRIVSIPMDFRLYISVTVLHIKYIYSQWMRALPREREQCYSCGGVVLYDPSYSESYIDFPHSVHSQRRLNQHPHHSPLSIFDPTRSHVFSGR